MEMLDEQAGSFAGRISTAKACEAFGLNARSYRHRQQVRRSGSPARARDRKPKEVRKAHPASLSSTEIKRVLDILCSEKYCDMPPTQVYHALLDEGTYVCSISSMYRILVNHGLLFERRRGGHSTRGLHPIPRLHATGPDECWTWDITRLRGPHKGVFYHLYTILDIFTRCVVGWTIAERESEVIATELIAETCKTRGINENQLTIHADRGSPMMAGSMSELFISLGVTKSHSRPRVSNDNPYSEAQFKTMKYHSTYPERFGSIQDARTWMRKFMHWYNNAHYHSGIAYMRPADLHAGRNDTIIAGRQATLNKAAKANPDRFNRPPKAAKPPTQAWINKPSILTT